MQWLSPFAGGTVFRWIINGPIRKRKSKAEPNLVKSQTKENHPKLCVFAFGSVRLWRVAAVVGQWWQLLRPIIFHFSTCRIKVIRRKSLSQMKPSWEIDSLLIGRCQWESAAVVIEDRYGSRLCTSQEDLANNFTLTDHCESERAIGLRNLIGKQMDRVLVGVFLLGSNTSEASEWRFSAGGG